LEHEIKPILNVYCDESCHILNDHQKYMGFGSVSAPVETVRSHSLAIRHIKEQFHCTSEMKWTKVSPKNIPFYTAIIEYFFNNTDLSFRAVVVHDKDELRHETFNQGSHDLFYYKMYYYLIRGLTYIHDSDTFHVYLDIKDTKGSLKVKKLKEVISNSLHDFEQRRVPRIQVIRSDEAELMQLTDFLLGSIMYATRGLDTSSAKQEITRLVQERAGYALTKSTEPWAEKFNLFHFWPRKEA